jgi:2-polyprenyl-3-methyl-5-hydroxy-6-metoxy-1,4-benzoquinol methylase
MKHNPSRELRYRQIIEILGDDYDSRILDFGAGDGQLVLRLLGLGYKAVGWEKSQAGVSRAKQSLLDSGFDDSIHLFKDFNNFPTEEFDVVIMSEVIEHLDNPQLVLQEIRKFVRPNGRFVITVPSGPVTYFDRYIGHKRHYSKVSLAETLQSAQLVPIQIKAIGFPVVHLVRLVCFILGDKMPRFVMSSGNRSWRENNLTKFVIWISGFSVFFGWQLVCVARKPI